MSKVKIAEHFYGEGREDPLKAGHPYELTLAGQAEEAKSTDDATELAEDSQTKDAFELSKVRAKKIVEGIIESISHHPKEKVLEHQDTDVRLKHLKVIQGRASATDSPPNQPRR